MVRRFTRSAALLAVGSAALAACGSNQEAPVAVATVQLAVVAGGAHGGMPFRTGMTQEVFHSPTFHTGDPDGTGSALITVNRGQKEICWQISTSNISLPATASHIHQAAPDVQGPIVVNLAPADLVSKAQLDNGAWSVCRHPGPDLAWATVEAIIANPSAYYVNVHNGEFPPGAVRGQLGQ